MCVCTVRLVKFLVAGLFVGIYTRTKAYLHLDNFLPIRNPSRLTLRSSSNSQSSSSSSFVSFPSYPTTTTTTTVPHRTNVISAIKNRLSSSFLETSSSPKSRLKSRPTDSPNLCRFHFICKNDDKVEILTRVVT